jgi:hypothetical protein
MNEDERAGAESAVNIRRTSTKGSIRTRTRKTKTQNVNNQELQEKKVGDRKQE